MSNNLNKKPSNDPGNLLLEIDDAMRRERMEKLWQKYGQHLVIFMLAVVLATAVYSGWNAWQERARIQGTEKLLALLEAENLADNINPAELDLRAPMRGMALVNAGGAYMQSAKTDKALEMYAAAAQDSAIPDEIRGLAVLMQARLLANNPDNAQDLQQVLEPVLDDKSSPWRPYGLIEAAVFAANEKSDYETARGYLAEILTNESLPPSLHSKARALDQLYAAKARQTPPQNPGDKS